MLPLKFFTVTLSVQQCLLPTEVSIFHMVLSTCLKLALREFSPLVFLTTPLTHLSAAYTVDGVLGQDFYNAIGIYLAIWDFITFLFL